MDFDDRIRQAKVRGLTTEARARIHWGMHPSDIVRWLVAEGAEETSARELIERLLKRRDGRVRSAGKRDLALGILLAFCVGLAFAAGLYGVTLILYLMIIAGPLGGCLIARGLIRCLLGGRAESLDGRGLIESVFDAPAEKS